MYSGNDIVDRDSDRSVDRSLRGCLSKYWKRKAARMDRLAQVSGYSLEALEGILKLAIHQVGVDQRCGEVAVPKGSLDYQDVPCSAVEVSSEGMAERMWAELLIDTCRLEPVVEPPGDLSLAEPPTPVGKEHCLAFSVAGASALCQVGSQEGA